MHNAEKPNPPASVRDTGGQGELLASSNTRARNSLRAVATHNAPSPGVHGEESKPVAHPCRGPGGQAGDYRTAQQTRAGVKEDQQVGHWETAARTLVAWLTEVLLQLGGTGHGATRAVHDEGSVATPAALLVDPLPAGMGQERFGQAAEQALEDPQGKSLSRLAEGRTGEGFVTLAG